VSPPSARDAVTGEGSGDGVTTRLTVRSTAGTFEVEIVTYQIYPAPIRDATHRLDAVRRKAMSNGTRYTADRVRVVVSTAVAGTGGAPWPEGVTVPSGAGPTRTTDLAGTAARTVTQHLTADWTPYRLPDGTPVQAAWRYLLPDE
jgi:hypothetical protein